VRKTVEGRAGRLTAEKDLSTSTVQEAKLNAPAVQVGESLANDLLGAIGETGNVAQDYYQASKEGALRVAADKRNEMALYIEQQKSMYNMSDPDHLKIMENNIGLKFAELSDQEFTLQDSQLAFDNAFTRPVGESTARVNRVLWQEQVKLTDEKNTAMLLDSTLLGYQNGLPLTEEQLRVTSDSMLHLKGEQGREGVFLNIAKTATQNFDTAAQTSFETVLKMGDYKAKDGLDLPTQKRIFEAYFGSAYGSIDDSGKIAWTDTFNSETGRDEILRSWGGFKSSYAKIKKDAPNYPLQEYKTRSSEWASTAKEGKSTPEIIRTQINEMDKRVEEMKDPNAVPLSDSDLELFYKNRDAMMIELTKASKVQNILIGSTDEVKGAVANGIKWKENGVAFEADAEYVKNTIISSHERINETMSSSDVNSPEFEQAVDTSIQLENKSGVKSGVLEAYRDGVTGNGLFESVDHVKKALNVSRKLQFKGSDNSLIKNIAFNAALEQLQARYDNGEFKSDQEFVTAANMKMQTLRQGIFSQADSGQFKRDWLTAMGESKDRWFHNVDFENKTREALMYKFIAEGGGRFNNAQEMEKFINENTTTFVGSATVFANFINPFSENATAAIRLQDAEGNPLKDNVYEDGIDNLVEKYNLQYPDSKIATSDIRVESIYLGGKGAEVASWEVSILKDDNLIPIGVYNGQQILELAAWRPDLPETDERLEGLQPVEEAAVEEAPVEEAPVEEAPQPAEEAPVPAPVVEEPKEKPFQISTDSAEIEPVESSFFETIRSEENSTANPRGGFDKQTNRWHPHKSFEGGAKTIAYGHKLTKEEQKSGKIMIGDTYYDLAYGLTENQAQRLFKQDFQVAIGNAEKAIGAQKWASMSRKNQLLAGEIQFNVRGGVKKFKKFIKAATSPDPKMQENAVNHIGRTATSPDGKKISLTKRTDALKKWYNEG